MRNEKKLLTKLRFSNQFTVYPVIVFVVVVVVVVFDAFWVYFFGKKIF